MRRDLFKRGQRVQIQILSDRYIADYLPEGIVKIPFKIGTVASCEIQHFKLPVKTKINGCVMDCNWKICSRPTLIITVIGRAFLQSAGNIRQRLLIDVYHLPIANIHKRIQLEETCIGVPRNTQSCHLRYEVLTRLLPLGIALLQRSLLLVGHFAEILGRLIACEYLLLPEGVKVRGSRLCDPAVIPPDVYFCK